MLDEGNHPDEKTACRPPSEVSARGKNGIFPLPFLSLPLPLLLRQCDTGQRREGRLFLFPPVVACPGHRRRICTTRILTAVHVLRSLTGELLDQAFQAFGGQAQNVAHRLFSKKGDNTRTGKLPSGGTKFSKIVISERHRQMIIHGEGSQFAQAEFSTHEQM